MTGGNSICWEGSCGHALKAPEQLRLVCQLQVCFFLPLAIDCAQRHTPQLRTKLGQLGDVVCNLKPEYTREPQQQSVWHEGVSQLKALQQKNYFAWEQTNSIWLPFHHCCSALRRRFHLFSVQTHQTRGWWISFWRPGSAAQCFHRHTWENTLLSVEQSRY